MDELTTFAGVQNNRDTDVGVFGVDTSTNFGNNFVNACIEVIKSINPDSYSQYNITRVIAEVLQKFCYQRDVSTKRLTKATLRAKKKLKLYFFHRLKMNFSYIETFFVYFLYIENRYFWYFIRIVLSITYIIIYMH